MVWVVARRSVALPFPSSPHWAPRTTIAGISTPHVGRCRRRHEATAPAFTVGPIVSALMDPLLVITNKDAGTADQETLEVALGELRSRTSVEVAATSDPGELDGVLQLAGSRRIVVAGGDGSLHAVMSALHRRHQLADVVVALLPLGTGNDFARGVGIPLDIEEAARVVVEGQVRPMDLIVDEVGEIVVNNVHAGLSAQASRSGHGWKKRLGAIGIGKVTLGKLGYPIGALQSVLHPPALHLRVEVDGRVVNDL